MFFHTWLSKEERDSVLLVLGGHTGNEGRLDERIYEWEMIVQRERRGGGNQE